MTISAHKNKNTLLLVILAINLLLFIIFLIMDWVDWGEADQGISDISEILKYIYSCLTVIVALMVGSDGLDKRDTLLIRIGFGFIFCADTFLVILNRFFEGPIHRIFFVAGVCCFMGLHCILILRHSRDLLSTFRKKERPLIIYFVKTALIVCALAILNIYVAASGVREIIQTVILITYAIILTLSLWTGWTTFKCGFFPRTHAWLIAIGLTIHFISDLCIVLRDALPVTAPITHPLIWTLYGPAIVLLALSGYRTITLTGAKAP